MNLKRILIWLPPVGLAVLVGLALWLLTIFARGLSQPEKEQLWWLAGSLVFALAIVLLLFILRRITEPAPYSPTLVALAPFAVMVAVSGTVIGYLLHIELLPNPPASRGPSAALIGLVAGALGWLLAAIVYSRMGLSSVEGANPVSYGLLLTRLDALWARLCVLCTEGRCVQNNNPGEPGKLGADAAPVQSAQAQPAGVQPAMGEGMGQGANPGAEAALAQSAQSQEAGGQVAQTQVAQDNKPQNGQILTEARRVACEEAWTQYDFLRSALSQNQMNEDVRRLQWVSGHGYIDLWNRLHRAEEALVNIERVEDLAGYAAYDRLRLEDSQIPSQNDLIQALEAAAKKLGLPLWKFTDANKASAPIVLGNDLIQALEAKLGLPLQKFTDANRASGAIVVGSDGDDAATPSPPDPVEEKKQRAILQQVRRTINEFRDNTWGALIQTRNRLIEAVTFASLAAYALLVIAILLGATPGAVGAATVFFLVGAIVGLFNQLRISAETNASIDDYGLAHAHLVNTPVLSGLAAIGGVVLFAMIPAALNAQAVEPEPAEPTPAVAAPTPEARIPGPASNLTLTLASTPKLNYVRIVADTAQGEEIRSATSMRNVAALSVQRNSPSFIQEEATPTSTTEPTAEPTTQPTPTATLTPTVGAAAAPTATATPAPGAAAAPTHLPGLDRIFSLEKNLFGLIVAATFGFAPTLLLRALQKQTNKYNLDIQSTEAQESARLPNSRG